MYPPKTNLITPDQVDRLLAEWHANLRVATDNLLALDDSLTYKRLEGKDGLPQTRLTGRTQALVTPALAAMHDLFQHIGRLAETVERAQELRRGLSRFLPNPETLRQIEYLLTGPSVRLPSARTPLAQRSLMSTSESPQTITPARLLDVMMQAFEVARFAIMTVDSAWARLEPALGECEAQAIVLERLAGGLGENNAPDVVLARERLAAVRANVESDPLRLFDDFDSELRSLLERARLRLGEADRQRGQMRTELERGRALLTQLHALNQQCADALESCRQQIENPDGLKSPLAPDALAELERWLGTLDEALAQGRWKAAHIGLDRWLQTTSEYARAANAALAANNAPIELRSELKGRLSALKAKARARGMDKDTHLTTLAGEAETLLHQCPTPNARVARLVHEYETSLAQTK